MAANRNRAGAPLRYAESLSVALTVAKSMMRVPYKRCSGR